MNNIERLINQMPNDYEGMAQSSGAMQRAREIKSVKDLMLLCLTYLFRGLTLEEVAIFANVKSIANISNVNFMKRFAKCRSWFKNIAAGLEFPEKIGETLKNFSSFKNGDLILAD